MMRSWWFVTPVLLALSATTPQVAAGVVIYRCTDAFGALTIQNDMPCAKGSKQTRQVVDVPPPMPAYQPVMPMPAPESPSPVLAEPAAEAINVDAPGLPPIPDEDRLPPPVLFQCNTFDNDSYLSEDSTPEPRCVRLDTVGLDGSVEGAAGVACQMVTDQCQRIADGAACQAWKQRLRETQAAWKFAPADDAEPSRLEFERVQRIVRESTCGK